MRFKLPILLIALLVITANALAQENSTGNLTKKGLVTTIVIDTGGQLGTLKYEEAYYIKNNSGNLTLDQVRLFFNGSINQSKIQLKILRPLKDGKPYIAIRAIATLDNKTILNSWYRPNSTSNVDPNNATKKSPGFEGIVLVLMFLILCIFKNKNKK